MAPLATEEPIARFIRDRNYYRVDRTLRHSAFMPWRQDMQVSVFRIYDLGSNEIWELGSLHIVTSHGQQLLGRADLKVSDVTNIGLQVIPDEPPPRHANITAWPEDNSKHKLLAAQLAAKASLHLTSDAT